MHLLILPGFSPVSLSLAAVRSASYRHHRCRPSAAPQVTIRLRPGSDSFLQTRPLQVRDQRLCWRHVCCTDAEFFSPHTLGPLLGLTCLGLLDCLAVRQHRSAQFDEPCPLFSVECAIWRRWQFRRIASNSLRVRSTSDLRCGVLTGDVRSRLGWAQ